MKRLTNGNQHECVVCRTNLDLKNHTHVVRTFVKFAEDAEITMISGHSCCVCVTRLSARQVPSPYKEEAGQNTLQDSAPVPFTPQVDWGALERMERFAELTKDTQTARQVKAKLTKTTQKKAEEESKPW